MSCLERKIRSENKNNWIPNHVGNDRRNGKSRARSGFTLMEVMMAVGIFAIGMGMIASMFPAAIKETEATLNDYEGPAICENALAIVKAKVTHANANTPVTASLAVLSGTAIIGDTDRQYRTYGTRERGFIALAKQWNNTTDRNDFQIVILAYDIKYLSTDVGRYQIANYWLQGRSDINGDGDTTDTAAEYPAGSGYTHNETNRIGLNVDRFTITSTDYPGTADRSLLVGSPVIDRNSGRYATIIAVEGDDIILDHPLGENSQEVLVFVQWNNNTSSIVEEANPVISVLVTRTALRE